MWDKGPIWLESLATPEPNTETVCRMGTLGALVQLFKYRWDPETDKDSYTWIKQQNTTDIVEKEWGGSRITGNTWRNTGR